jgi:RNA polymerase sigma factor (sigma-70 family)
VDKPSRDYPPEGGADEISALVRRAVAGEPGALEGLVEWLGPLMASWVRARAPEGELAEGEPEDLVQEVWLRVLPLLHELRPHPSEPGRLTPALLATVKRVLRNHLIDLRRRAARRRMQALPTDSSSRVPREASGRGPFSEALRRERGRLVLDALERVGPRDRELYVRRIFEEASLDELAAEFGMSRAAVIKARQRARHVLAEVLAPQVLDELEANADGAGADGAGGGAEEPRDGEVERAADGARRNGSPRSAP